MASVVRLWTHIGSDVSNGRCSVDSERTIDGARALRRGRRSLYGSPSCRFPTALQFRSLSPVDQDQVVLLFLATLVILLAVIVILFTVCFWLLVPRRSRPARRV
jgi:hypothetical protein